MSLLFSRDRSTRSHQEGVGGNAMQKSLSVVWSVPPRFACTALLVFTKPLKKNKSKSVSFTELLLVACEEMSLAIKKNHPYCTLGFCCSFSSSIPAKANCTLVKPPKAPVLQSTTYSSDDEDYSLVNHYNANKRCRCTLGKQNTFQQEHVNFLRKYSHDTNTPTSMAPPQVHQILKDINRRRDHSRDYR